MSFPLDTPAQNNWLDCLLGDGAGTSSPASFEFALFAGDPFFGGVEMDSVGGYVRPVISNNSTQWPDAVDGQKVGLAVPFADPSNEWTAGSLPVPATHFLLIDAADSTTRYVARKLSEPLVVTGTETDLSVQPILTWNTEGA